MKYIFIRHCQTDWNDANKLQGHMDICLNEKGRIQAKALAEKIVTHYPTVIVSSDLSRAVETAAIIADRIGVEIRHDARLRECSFGRLEGKTLSEIEYLLGIKKEGIWRGGKYPYDFTRHGGESRTEVIHRHLELINEIAKTNNRCVLFVGHRVGLSTLLAQLGDDIVLENGEIRVIEYSFI